jgi:hypothetical protein
MCCFRQRRRRKGKLKINSAWTTKFFALFANADFLTGYQLILNNALFPAAKKKKRKT